MNQAERRLYLIRYLLAEDRRLAGMEIPPDKKGQEDLLRALMNIRPPKPVGEEFLAVQDAYLREERDARGTTDASTLTPVRDNLCLWQGDITTLAAGGIVNAANSALLGCFHPLHGCIDNIIHSRAGVQLRLACNRLMEAQGHEEPTGRAKITPAYNLPSRYVLHTVGPVITGRVTGEDERLLASCYRSCLALAAENGLESLAFCCISTGEFHFPNRLAAETAVQTVEDWTRETESGMKVIFNVFKDTDLQIYREILEGEK